MALDKQKKLQIVEEVSGILDNSKMIVLASYGGTSVKSLQELRKQALANQTVVKVIKNRLFKKALENSAKFKELSPSMVEGQLLYAFSDSDEVAPAQSLANFAKAEPQIRFVGAFSADGQLLDAADVQQLASLPSKQQLLGQLVATTAAPLSGFTAVLNGNIRGLLNVLSAKVQVE